MFRLTHPATARAFGPSVLCFGRSFGQGVLSISPAPSYSDLVRMLGCLKYRPVSLALIAHPRRSYSRCVSGSPHDPFPSGLSTSPFDSPYTRSPSQGFCSVAPLSRPGPFSCGTLTLATRYRSELLLLEGCSVVQSSVLIFHYTHPTTSVYTCQVAIWGTL